MELSLSGLSTVDHSCLASTVKILSPRKPMLEIVMDWNRVEGNWKQVKGRSRRSGASSLTMT